MRDVNIGDLEALIRFREHLVHFNRTLKDEFHSMRSHWGDMRDVWSDEKSHEFERALDEVWPGIRKYLEVTNDHEEYLRRLIDKLEAIKGIHLL